MGKNLQAEDLPKAMRLMAECAVARRAGMVRSWLGTLPGSDEEERIFDQQLGDLGLCLNDDQLVADGKTLEVRPAIIRNPLALAMARQQLRRSTVAPVISKDNVWFATRLAALGPDGAINRNALGLQDFGHCVAASDWSNARALILSEEGSVEQKNSVSALIPSLGPCLPTNVQIKLTPQNLRVALAEPMVHILMGLNDSSSSK
jgi:hypothetical protein